MNKHKNPLLLLIAIIVLLEGFSILLLPNKSSLFLGLLLIFASLTYLFLSLNSSVFSYNSNFLERYKSYFIYVGFFIIVSTLILNFIVLRNEFGQFDLLLLFIGLGWISFNSIPLSYSKERDFIFVFLHVTFSLFLFQNLFFIIIDNASLISGWNFNEFFVHALLAKPLGNFLSILGYDVFVDRDTLIYYDTTLGYTQRVWIADDCSGIYSIFIFVSFFISYIIVEYKKLDLYALYFLIIGIISAYAANILRMALIVLAGHYRGEEALQWAHVNIGWMLFTLWMFIFWTIIINTLGINENNFKNRNRT